METKQTYKIGNCLDLLPNIPDKSIDLVLTDPPYGIQYHSGWYVSGNPFSPIQNDEFNIDFNSKWLKLCSDKSKDNGCLLLFTGYQVLPKWIPLIEKHWIIKNLIIWVKNNWSAGDLNGNFGNQYEIIIFGVKGKFQIKDYRYSNIWNFNRIPPSSHPTTKPVLLLKRCIESTTSKNDTILDPFLGGGTVLRACLETERDGMGFEIDPNYENEIKQNAGYLTNRIKRLVIQ